MDTLFKYLYMRIIVAVLGMVIVVAIISITALTLNIVSPEFNHATINVEGVAEVSAIPDIGVFHFTVKAEAEDVAQAQTISGEKVNAIMTYLQSEGGVDEKDIRTTGYNVHPRYEFRKAEFNHGGTTRILVEYVVTQNIRVTVRDTEQAGRLIGAVGGLGATNMSRLSFKVDNIEPLKEEARLLAVSDAKEKAIRLADELGVRLGDIVHFNDGGSRVSFPTPIREVMMLGDSESSQRVFPEPAFSPNISIGEDIITARVTITYKIR